MNMFSYVPVDVIATMTINVPIRIKKNILNIITSLSSPIDNNRYTIRDETQPWVSLKRILSRFWLNTKSRNSVI